ncbi:MAG: DNA mismatch repair protein MutS, partial [Cyanobacteria bacterium]|nr:DNA mismatch repair protein MutS [Cyanobacteriota bacterium]
MSAVNNPSTTGFIEEKLSGLMRQYWDVKAQYPESLLFFRVGDFYEMFDSDAQVASRELDITLTSRPEPSYVGGRVPMAGVPYRAAEAYLGRLLARGYSIAICEQVGVPGKEKGPVAREVARILTPGTVLESHLLPGRENNYLAAIVQDNSMRGNADPAKRSWGLAYVDASCGEFRVAQLTEEELLLELGRLDPREVLVPLRVVKPGEGEVVAKEVPDAPESIRREYRLTARSALYFQFQPAMRRIFDTFGVSTLEGFGCQSLPLAVGAAGAVLEYLHHTQGAERPKFDGISTYSPSGHLVLDANTRRNLELTETSRDRTFHGSLLWSLDKTKTSMGARRLRQWLLSPLFSAEGIHHRHDCLAELISSSQLRDSLSGALSKLSDLERLSVRLTSGTVSPKDLAAVQASLAVLPEISQTVQSSTSAYLTALAEVPEPLMQLQEKIATAIREDAPREITEGNIFVDGYNEELDEIRSLLGGG